VAPRWRFVSKEILPKPRVLALVGVALGLTLVGLVCSIAFALTADTSGDPPEMAASMFGCFLLPVVLVVLLVGTLLDKRPLPRALIWALMALLTALAAIILALAMSTEPELGFSGSLMIFFVFGAPVVLLLFAPAIYYVAKGWRGLQTTVQRERIALCQRRIDVAGRLALSDLAEELGVDDQAAARILAEGIAQDKIQGHLDVQSGQIYSQQTLSDRRLELLGVLKAHGQIALDSLARTLDAPQALITEWIYDLVQHGRFSGYINWERGMLYSAERAKLGQSQRCPSCGGRLELAGKGIVSCTHCGAEILL